MLITFDLDSRELLFDANDSGIPAQIFFPRPSRPMLCNAVRRTSKQRHECHYLRYFLSTATRRYAGHSRRGVPEGRTECKILSHPEIGSFMSTSSLEKALQAKQRGWKRRHERYRTDFPVKATVLRDSGYEGLAGRCGDIGHGGMGVVFNAECVKGEVLSLEFSLPLAAEILSVRSIVRYHRGFLHGLEFLGLTGEQQEAIDAFCNQLTPSA